VGRCKGSQLEMFSRSVLPLKLSCLLSGSSGYSGRFPADQRGRVRLNSGRPELLSVNKVSAVKLRQDSDRQDWERGRSEVEDR
jgi:hypothetical protein